MITLGEFLMILGVKVINDQKSERNNHHYFEVTVKLLI